MDSLFRNAAFVAYALLFGSALMLFAEYVAKKNSQKDLSTSRGFWIGCFQSLALLNGVSRSGATISGGLILGLTREASARFSFLLSIPIILGSGGKKLFDLASSGALGGEGLSLLVGSIVSFVVGLLAIDFLMRFVRKKPLTVFVLYRVVLALVIIFSL
jgi:undecaprenyl-diphosphatase